MPHDTVWRSWVDDRPWPCMLDMCVLTSRPGMLRASHGSTLLVSCITLIPCVSHAALLMHMTCCTKAVHLANHIPISPSIAHYSTSPNLPRHSLFSQNTSVSLELNILTSRTQMKIFTYIKLLINFLTFLPPNCSPKIKRFSSEALWKSTLLIFTQNLTFLPLSTQTLPSLAQTCPETLF